MENERAKDKNASTNSATSADIHIILHLIIAKF